WIALESGIAGTADVILIPEIPYDLDRVCEKIEDRYQSGRRFAIVVAAEGAVPKNGTPTYIETGVVGKADRLGGIAERLSKQIMEKTGRETRELVLGHLQRGGMPTSFDRLIATRFGAAAVRAIEQGKFGTMVALDPPNIVAVPMKDAISRIKRVPLDSDLVQTARDVGISFGD